MNTNISRVLQILQNWQELPFKKKTSALNQSAFVLQPHYSPRLLANPLPLCSVREPPRTQTAQFSDEALQQ